MRYFAHMGEWGQINDREAPLLTDLDWTVATDEDVRGVDDFIALSLDRLKQMRHGASVYDYTSGVLPIAS